MMEMKIMARKRGRKKSRRKTYRTKSAAKKKCGKGRSPYKVKGGWRCSKKK